MPLVPMTDLFSRTRAGGYAVGYFEAWDSYSLEAVLAAAEAEQAPVILGFGCMMASGEWLEAGGIETLAGLGLPLARRARVPVALLLNEAHSLEQAKRGIDAGFNAVMMDSSAWEWDRAVREVAALVAYAQARGASVEAELGHLPDAVEGGIDDSAAALTDPEQAAEFARLTGIDCLAVSVGNVHLLTEGYAPVDLDHLEAIYRRVGLPLVMHGGTSFPPQAVPRAIVGGVAKFNVGTILKKSFLEAVRAQVCAWPERVDPHQVLGSHQEADLLNAGKASMTTEVRRLIRLYGASGKALS
ncbi:MAG: class II fructose-bisphosphate aldolase [Candidatus Latescibacteria bacterium]|nr:class II fructose-bisphosphate aldolase [Candidatus Latescibacterota bacterium]